MFNNCQRTAHGDYTSHAQFRISIVRLCNNRLTNRLYRRSPIKRKSKFIFTYSKRRLYMLC